MVTLDLPRILIASAEHADHLLDEFGRYTRDYALEAFASGHAALRRLDELSGPVSRVPLLVLDVALNDIDPLELLDRVRQASPHTRRLGVAHLTRFLDKSEGFSAHVARGKLEAYNLMPRGARDEEFHQAVTELLSDWGATAVAPLVSTIQIVDDGTHRALVTAIKDFASRMGMPVSKHSPDDPDGQAIVARWTGEPALPLVAAMNHAPIAPASVHDVAIEIYGRPDTIKVAGELADLVIIGAGPAGLAAAVYGASEGLTTVVLEAEAIGGQAGTSSMIRNYLGFPRGISGMRLAQRARVQALRFGARFFAGWPVTSVEVLDDGTFCVRTDGGDVPACSVVVACGVDYRKLGVESVEQLVGRGVHYGAAMSVAPLMQDRDVVVVGGGNSAGQAALHLARFARTVTIMIRRGSLTETMSQYLIDEIETHPRVGVRVHSQVVDAGGEPDLEWIEVRDTVQGTLERREVAGLFLLLGAETSCDWLPEQLARDPDGFVRTGRDVPRDQWVGDVPPGYLETSIPGMFAGGDVRSGSMKRVAAATGEGASIVSLVHAHLSARA